MIKSEVKTLNKSRLLEKESVDQKSVKYNIHEIRKMKFGDFMGCIIDLLNMDNINDNEYVIYTYIKNYETGGVDVYLDTHMQDMDITKGNTYIPYARGVLRDSRTGFDYTISEIEDDSFRDAYILMLEDIESILRENNYKDMHKLS